MCIKFVIRLLAILFIVETCAHAGQPNVVVFLVDDMGWADSEVYGSTFYESPAQNRLADEGMVFTQAYAHPLCSPSRAALLSGQYPGARFGLFQAITGNSIPNPSIPDTASPKQSMRWPGSADKMPLEVYTLAEALRDAGYQTWHLGKWHLNKGQRGGPEEQGFEQVVGVGGSGPAGGYFAPYRVPKFPQGPDGEYISERMAQEACKLLEKRNRDQPFFMYYACFNVHSPYECKPDLLAYYEKKLKSMPAENRQTNPVMAAMLHAMDRELKTLLDKLDELKLAQDTLVVFISDNGGVHFPMKINSEISKAYAGMPPTVNGPLRGGKCTYFEGGVRVPMLIRWPGKIRRQTTTDAPVHLIDLYPTILAATGTKPQTDQVLDGIDLSPLFRAGETFPERPLFCHFPRKHIVADNLPGGSFIRSGDYKLIRIYGGGENGADRFVLYNLKDDIGETTDLAAAMPEKTARLRKQLNDWLTQTGALIPKPNPAYQKKSAAN